LLNPLHQAGFCFCEADKCLSTKITIRQGSVLNARDFPICDRKHKTLALIVLATETKSKRSPSQNYLL
ncbi:hypothetical protein, partial [Citrobacter sp. RHB21-C01]